LAKELETQPVVPGGWGERFVGYGVLGLPFASGHLLAFRRVPASSLGLAFTAVWHMEPSGKWTFFVDVDPESSSPRFFGEALDRVLVADINLSWEGPREVSVEIPEVGLQWAVRLSADLLTRGMTTVGRLLPGPLWRNQRLVSMFGKAGGRFLGLGKTALTGSAPNGQRFLAAPRLFWRIGASVAVVDGEELGPVAPLLQQARLGDFWLPNRGVFVFGEARFERLDPSRHSRNVLPGTRDEAMIKLPDLPFEWGR
jgi:hypothetical protein